MNTEISEGHQQRGRGTEVALGPGASGLLPFPEPGHSQGLSPSSSLRPFGHHRHGEEAGSSSNGGQGQVGGVRRPVLEASGGSRRDQMQIRKVGSRVY